MNNSGQYLIGFFRGNFSTEQELPLQNGGEMPIGLEHFMFIYRGSIIQTENFAPSSYSEFPYTTEFKAINNVEVNWGDSKSVKRTRIHSFSSIRFVSFSISDVHLIEGKTIGQIQGKIVGELATRPFTEEEIKKVQDDYNQDNDPFTINEKNIEVNINEENNDPIASDPNPQKNPIAQYIPNGCQRPGCQRPGCTNLGCLTRFNRVFRWLFYLFLILLTLFLFFKCSDFGRMIVCKYQIETLEEELSNIKLKQDSLERYIALTKSNVKDCGTSDSLSGANELKETFYNLGPKSGKVYIEFNVKDAPDRIEVIYDGKLIAETKNKQFKPYKGIDFSHLIFKGFAQNKIGSPLMFDYKYNPKKPTIVLIRVVPNQETPETQWGYTVNCPE